MDGSFLRFYIRENKRHHGKLLWEWLLEQGNRMGVRGGSAFRAMAGFGRHQPAALDQSGEQERPEPTGEVGASLAPIETGAADRAACAPCAAPAQTRGPPPLPPPARSTG